MSRKLILYGYPIVPDHTDMLDEDFISEEIDVATMDQLSIHYIVYTSGSGSALSLEVQNGKDDGWYALDFGGTLDVSAIGEFQIVLTTCPFTKIRMHITGAFDNSDLIMTANITSKTVGA